MTEAGFESSGVGDVFVCKQAQDSPVVESEVTSMLPEDGGQSSRTQHGRAAVGVEPSVIYNAWENGTVFLCSFRVIFVFGSQSRFMSSQVGCGFITCWCLCLVGLESVLPASPMLMSAAQCVLLARSAAHAERTETLMETKTLAKRKLYLVINSCSVFCSSAFVLLFPN